MPKINDVLLQIAQILNGLEVPQERLNINLAQARTSFDTVLIKKLAKTNTLTHPDTAKQTHIALTAAEMDIFPYLHNYNYLDSSARDVTFKRKYVLKLPLILLANNINYLAGEFVEQQHAIIESYTTTARSKRGDGSQQVEVSYIDEDDANFVSFRKQLFTGDYIIFLKYYEEPKYLVLGIKEADADRYSLEALKGLSVAEKVGPTPVQITLDETDTPIIKERNLDYKNPMIKQMIDLLERNPNLILYGPPGTGKTYYINQLKEYFDHSELITFHQSYSYEQFIEGITANVDKGTGQLNYSVAEGIFREIAEHARNNASQKVALFIDEINRGNISKIFGELITLIEKSKRQDEEEETVVKLPYSKKPFTVPKNLYIIGTMNTSDRSVALIDIALRRRFSFFEITPDFKPFKKAEPKVQTTIKAIQNINALIKKTIDKEHMIGNSYFFSLLDKKDNDLDEQLKYIWLYQILPLLQEYFYTNPKIITDTLGALISDDDQRFSFSINYGISNEELLAAISSISVKDLD